MIHLFTYKTLKQTVSEVNNIQSLIHLFTYKTLKQEMFIGLIWVSLIHLFTYKTLKLLFVFLRILWVWFTYSLTRLSNISTYMTSYIIVWFTYSLTRLSNRERNTPHGNWFDSLIHLQDSQTSFSILSVYIQFDSLIHLQDSQTHWTRISQYLLFDSLIHLQDSQTLWWWRRW